MKSFPQRLIDPPQSQKPGTSAACLLVIIICSFQKKIGKAAELALNKTDDEDINGWADFTYIYI